MCTGPLANEGPFKCGWKHGESVSNKHGLLALIHEFDNTLR
jgi:hypothetical protein